MLLRIDVYPHNAAYEEVDKDGIPVSPIPPLYACLGTSKPDGELFTVGRKESDVIFSADKSVSRRHLTVSLMTTHDSIEDRVTVKPVTPEEEEVCESDPDKECIAVKDSSKFGTFLVKEGNARSKVPSTDKDATDGSDTEDESQPQGLPEGVSLSPVTATLTNSKATLERMDANSSLVLPQLKDRIIIQCGQNGSTLLIRRIALSLLWSRLDKSTRELWKKRVPALGASTLSKANEAMTHLVSNERLSNAKHLAAWYMKKPIVTTEYLQALWDRRSPNDPMPNESDCEPTIGKDAFWNKTPNTNLLAGTTFLAILDDDFGPLCHAAGATVIPLYEESENKAIERIQKMNMTNAFYISSSSAKVAKIVKYLKKKDVSHVTQKAVGQSLVNMTQLESNNGAIGPPPPPPQDEVIAPPPENEHAAMVVPPSEEKEDEQLHSKLPPMETIPEASREMSEESMEQDTLAKEASTRKKRSKSSTQEPVDEEGPPKQRRKTSKEPVDESVTQTSSRKERTDDENVESSSRKKRSNEPESDMVEEPPKQRRKTSKEQEEENFADTSSQKKCSKDDSEPVEEEPPIGRKMSKDVEPVEENNREENDEPDEWNEGDEPKKLEVSNGWFVAAPSGKRRKAYLRPIGDDTFDEPPPPTADTENCSNLVVGPRTTARRTQFMGRRGGKDFKKFCKNRITKGAVSRVQLRSVLPKESEVEHALDESERALEEEQRLADALFRDPGGGIRSHFKLKRRKST